MKKKKIYALSGPSGAGKTYYRMHDAHLKDLPCVDVADIYDAHPGIAWDVALVDLINQVLSLLDEHDEICVEAYFRRKSVQREHLEYYTQGIADVQYIELVPEFEVCKQRILKDVNKDTPERTQARLDLLEKCYYTF